VTSSINYFTVIEVKKYKLPEDAQQFLEIAIVMQLETALLHLFWCLSSGQEFHFPLMPLNLFI
jgi:hypothetical protein